VECGILYYERKFKVWVFVFCMAREFKNLNVWIRGVKFCKVINDLVRGFPRIEDFALSSQIRRAVISVPSNIAEGCGRGTGKDLIRFLYMALGSVNEVVTQLYVAREFGYIDDDRLKELDKELGEIGRMIVGFIGYAGTRN